MSDILNVKDLSRTGVDFLGFIFYPGSKRYVGENPDQSLFRQVPKGVLKVGVFVNEKADQVLKISDIYKLDMIQLHGKESAEYCSSLSSSGVLIIKTFGIDRDFDFTGLKHYLMVCDYFLFDTKTNNYGGSGSKFDWSKIDDYHMDKPFFLSGGIGPEDSGIIKAFDHKQLYCIDINSRFETNPGLKDPDMVKIFINEIKSNTI